MVITTKECSEKIWKRLQKYDLVSYLPAGEEDEAAFREGFGFADLVRRPTKRAKELSFGELASGTKDLIQRLVELGKPRPVIVFVFKKAFDICGSELRTTGY